MGLNDSIGVTGTVVTLLGTVFSIAIAYPNIDRRVLIVAALIATVIIIILINLVNTLLNKILRRFKSKETIDLQLKWISAEKLETNVLLKNRPYKQYRPRQEDAALRKLILEKKNVLVKGSPLAGKTRTVFEVIKSLGKSVNVFIPSPEDIKREDFFPKNTGKNLEVVILDDLNRFVEIGSFEKLMAIISEKNLVIVATCQTGDPFNIVKSKLVDKRLDLETIFGKNIIYIGDITEDEARQIAKNEKINWKDTEFDGTIGSVFLELNEMRNRYNALDVTEKDLLKTIKKLQISGIYEGNHIFPYEWIETAFNANYPDTKFHWERVLEPLKNSELVSVPEDEEKKIHVEEVYLEKIVEFAEQPSELTILNKMLTVFSNNPDVLTRIGYRASSLASIRLETRNLSKIAITVYEEALKVYTLDEFPIQYAMTQNNLGTAYSDLASIEYRKKNLEKAIKAYGEALKVRTFTKFPMDYAMTQNNLGNTYRILASVEDTKNNLEKAIKAHKEALKVHTFNDFPIQYATVQNNLGAAYSDLASVEDRKNNLQKAIKAYQKALKVHTFNEFPMDYATTQNNLGIVYRNLASVEGAKNNLKKAIKAYKEALKVRTLAEFPMDYAMTQNNLGNAYGNMASVEDAKNNLETAIKAYGEALKVRTFAEFPMDYAMTQNNLGNTYRILANVEDAKNNLEKAIKAYKEALIIHTFDDFPMQYATVQNNLGNTYRNLASVEDNKNNLKKAIKAYQETLTVYTFDDFPIHYAMVQNNLGIACSDLAGLEDTKNNLQKAITAYEEALKIYEQENMESRAEPLRQVISTLQAQLQQP